MRPVSTRALGLAATLAVLVLAGGASPATVAPCAGSQLTGSFRVVYGSAGAGNIVYALGIRNRSTHSCFVSGLAQLRLLGRTGRPLPTHVLPTLRGGLTAVRVVLRPGARARATARFSPDVPGPGEPVGHTVCEPKSYRLRVVPRPGGGTFVVPVEPPTAVCEHGRLELSAFSRA